MSEKWGILIAGLGGYTGTTFSLGVRAHQLGLLDGSATITHSEPWSAASLPSLNDVVISGWDVTDESLLERARRQAVLPDALLQHLGDDSVASAGVPIGVRCRSDFGADASWKPPPSPVDTVRESIRLFKSGHGLEKVVVVILLSPELPVSEHLYSAPARELDLAAEDPDSSGLRSSQIYSLAALHEGCTLVDFTANASLELEGLSELAKSVGVAMAGRDGSTGETAFKLHLADFFRSRQLHVRGWYGTNILGNPDGLALTQPDRRVLKMRDKTEGLALSLGYDVPDHSVTIEHYRPRGDNKEFWDVVDVDTWLGGDATLRLNWIGPDSLLAGQILCDITRIMASDLVADRSGIVGELGYFFKHPLGIEERSLEDLWSSLHSLLE